MSLKVALFFCLVVAVFGNLLGPSDYYIPSLAHHPQPPHVHHPLPHLPPPVFHELPHNHHFDNHDQHDHHIYHDYPNTIPQYTYSYGVLDDEFGVNFGAEEYRDGDLTEGSYFVNLPDGRKQLVTYSDHGDGLIAEVTYDGIPQPHHHHHLPVHA